MNLNSGEIHKLNIKSLSKWPYLWRCCRCFAAWVGSVCLHALHSFVFSFHFSVIHSVVIVHGAGDIRLLFKLLLKFRNVLKHTERRSSLACNQNIKDDIPTALEVFLCFETERNDINSPRKHPGNVRVISAEELSTMSEKNLTGITLDIGPIVGIYSLTLIISW